MYSSIPPPIALGMCGGLAGFIGGGFNQCFPIWVGTATGASLGCITCIYFMITPEPAVTTEPVVNAKLVTLPINPVIVQNIYIITGNSKDIPVKKMAETI